MNMKLYKLLLNYKITCFFIDILSWIYRSVTIKNIDPNIIKNLEWVTSYNIDLNWFYKEKNKWISGVARLKNGDDYLEKVIESYINYLDEIILVDNQSNDNTWKICTELQAKYPDKIKVFSYEYDVIGAISKTSPPTNSIHSLAYYYNWSFAKSQYEYVMKIDDDNLMIPEKMAQIRKSVLSWKRKRYNIFHGINVIKAGNQIAVSWDIIYAGFYGDHWIYPVSPQTYYLQSERCEVFKNPYLYKRFGLSYFHLKFIKKNMWCSNYWDENKTYDITKWFRKYLKLSQFITSGKNIRYLKNNIK